MVAAEIPDRSPHAPTPSIRRFLEYGLKKDLSSG